MSKFFKTWMANHILPLPIDQRYGKEDMERIIQILKYERNN